MRLQKFIKSDNIATMLDSSTLATLGTEVVEGFDLDKASRSEWDKKTEDALDIALQVAEEKTFPWPGAANIKYPLITDAMIQFAARAYPEIIRGDSVVKGKVVGSNARYEQAMAQAQQMAEQGMVDQANMIASQAARFDKEARAKRIGEHLSYQLLEEMPEWEPDTDKLLIMLPAIGTLHRKTYFDPLYQRNCSTLCLPKDIAIHNDARSLETARRVTHIVRLYKNEVIERQRSGIYLPEDKATLALSSVDDEQELHEFYEQHCWKDLDKDGYEEPYIVTVHKDTQKVVRILARYDEEGVFVDGEEVIRIEPEQYFTDYHFIPDPKGGYWSYGFGQLLLPINESVNTVINQLLDAGTLSNTQSGFLGKNIKLKGGAITLEPGEWKQLDIQAVELKNGIVPLPAKEPSMVLFQLLGFLVQAGKGMSSTADILKGESSGANEPVTTVLTRVEQGLKVYGSIYKRIYRGLKKEFKKLARLNYRYGNDEYYFRILDQEKVALREDYNDKDCDVIPVADPNAATDVQRAIRGEAIRATIGAPGVDAREAMKIYCESIKLSEGEIKRLVPEQDPNAGPPPEMLKIQLEDGRLALDKDKNEAQKSLWKTQELLNVANAQAKNPQLDYIVAIVEQLHGQLHQATQEIQQLKGASHGNFPGAVPGMAGPSSNGGDLPIPIGGEAGGPGEIMPPGDLGPDAIGGSPEGGAA